MTVLETLHVKLCPLIVTVVQPELIETFLDTGNIVIKFGRRVDGELERLLAHSGSLCGTDCSGRAGQDRGTT